MHIGALRNSITVQEKTSTGTNDLNEETFSWTTWRTILCEVISKRGAENMDPMTGQRYSQTYYRFRCRYSDVDGIGTTKRILFEDQTYDIKNILPDHQNREDCVIEATLQDGTV